MKQLKALLAVNDSMQEALCRLHGCEEEDDLPDAIQDLDLGQPDLQSVDALLNFLTNAMPKADVARLREIAERTVKELRSIE